MVEVDLKVTWFPPREKGAHLWSPLLIWFDRPIQTEKEKEKRRTSKTTDERMTLLIITP